MNTVVQNTVAVTKSLSVVSYWKKIARYYYGWKMDRLVERAEKEYAKGNYKVWTDTSGPGDEWRS